MNYISKDLRIYHRMGIDNVTSRHQLLLTQQGQRGADICCRAFLCQETLTGRVLSVARSDGHPAQNSLKTAHNVYCQKSGIPVGRIPAIWQHYRITKANMCVVF